MDFLRLVRLEPIVIRSTVFYDTIFPRIFLQTWVSCSFQLHRMNLEIMSQGGQGEASGQSAAVAVTATLANAMPLAHLLAKPGALAALGLSGLAALTSLSDMLTGNVQQSGSPAHRSDTIKRERFAPY